MSDDLTHEDGCSKPPPWLDHHIKPGWVRAKCPDCHHVANLPECPPARPPEPAKPKPIPTSGYRCRDHHDQPVTFRGKGCTLCLTRKARRHQTTGTLPANR